MTEKASERSDILKKVNDEDGVGNVAVDEFEIEAQTSSKFRILKNLAVICLAWLFQFTAFQAMANLQSSLNMEGNVGTNSLAILYAFLVVSALFLPNLCINTFGLKWAIAISQVTYFLYILANLYPIGALMYPAALLVGLGAAPLWTSQSSYITQIGNVYSKLTDTSADLIVSRFFGTFFMVFQTSQIWGNLISYFVLKPKESFNQSLINYSLCGAEFSPKTVNLTGGQADVSKITRYTLTGVYAGAVALAVIFIAVLLDQRRKPQTESAKETVKHSFKLIISASRHLMTIDQLLLIPITIWNGLEQSFFGAQLTQGVITCAYGIQTIGLAMICFGIMDAVGSFTSGRLVTYINRRYLFLIAASLNLIILIVILTWVPKPTQKYVPFILAGIWGLADSVWLTQVNAFYGIIFKDNMEAAFSNYRLWESVGFVLAYAYTPFIKIKVSVGIVLAFLILGLIGFFVIDAKHVLKRKRQAKQAEKAK